MSVSEMRALLINYISTADEVVLKRFMQVWESSDEDHDIELSQEQLNILRERELAYRKDPDRAVPWEVVKERLQKYLK